ncbi:hypothetical protein TNCV_483511 [Trichonephila clavipes]|uniref:Uncharacterized protein n=1 Tax=Trichonephila clavipes TaxID=2585209 RepID=A0A8X6R6Y2_TRICX|nr:hypothetical protein TNCV_483511 [Trichonephila clavipes]
MLGDHAPCILSTMPPRWPVLVAASPLVERKVTLRLLHRTALAATSSTHSIAADGKGKERNRLAGLSLPQPPSASDFMPSAPPLFGG